MLKMVDRYLTDEQRAIQDLAHEFAVKEVRPIAMELDHKTSWSRSATTWATPRA
jgi:hypothetical protein